MPTNPFAVLPLIGEDLPKYCKRLAAIPPCAFWVYETKIAQYLNLPQGADHGQCDILTTIIACTKKGYGGDKKKVTKVAMGLDAVNISE